MMNRNRPYLKAAFFTASMMLLEYYLLNNHEEHHHHHHHHHHDEEQIFIAPLINQMVEMAATVLLNTTRFGLSSMTNNNAVVMSVSEFAMSYFSRNGNISKGLFSAVMGGGTAAAINKLASNEEAELNLSVNKPKL